MASLAETLATIRAKQEMASPAPAPAPAKRVLPAGQDRSVHPAELPALVADLARQVAGLRADLESHMESHQNAPEGQQTAPADKASTIRAGIARRAGCAPSSVLANLRGASQHAIAPAFRGLAVAVPDLANHAGIMAWLAESVKVGSRITTRYEAILGQGGAIEE